MEDIQLSTCTQAKDFDTLLNSEAFSLLSAEQQIELYNSSVMAEDFLSENHT
jgi:hypothetical protein